MVIVGKERKNLSFGRFLFFGARKNNESRREKSRKMIFFGWRKGNFVGRNGNLGMFFFVFCAEGNVYFIGSQKTREGSKAVTYFARAGLPEFPQRIERPPVWWALTQRNGFTSV